MIFLKRFLTISAFVAFAPLLAIAQTVSVPSRITEAVDNDNRVTLRGNTHPLARPDYDRGAAPDSLPMERMLLVLTRSQGQESALIKLLDAQTNNSSPNFHHWLTPEQFGQEFGLASADLELVRSWLISQGFRVNNVSNGRTLIVFSGDAGLVRNAFHTQIHKYVVNGEEHWANTSDPQIPAALTPVVSGVVGLQNFHTKPMHHVAGVFSRSKDTGVVKPLFTFSSSVCPPFPTCYAVGPFDFAAIYNILPLWNAGIDGTGQTIAIVGKSNINLQDVRDFRSLFGLPAREPVVIIPPGSTDPGITGDKGETEADLDVEWSGAVAKNATIMFVTSASAATDGAIISAMHVIDANLAPIMSVSFGKCEFSLGSSENQVFNQLWQKAAAQGITVLVAAGDQGSASCDSNGAPTPAPAVQGLEVSGVASTPWDVAVGGTDFNDLTNATTFWNPSSNSTTQASAKGYIPETTWNESCTNADFGSNSEANCNSPKLSGFVKVVGGSGGASNCTSPTGLDASSCAGGYAKPSWQTGNGVPNDGRRDIPDVSLFASDGFHASFYVICQSDKTNNSCNLNSPFTNFVGIGGTSASSPAFAGIMALVIQKVNSRQGNANPVLYSLAAQQSGSSCNSNSGPANSCVFNDITTGTNAMPCLPGTLNCVTTNAGDKFGILSGYDASAGYDLATGLGSINAANLVNNWTSTTGGGGADFTLSPNPASINIAAAGQSGSSTITATRSGDFAGTVSFTCSVSPVPTNDPPICGVVPSSVVLDATTTSATANLKVSTTAVLGSQLPLGNPTNKPDYFAVNVELVLACVLLLGVFHQKRRGPALFAMTLLVLVGVTLSSCASGGNGGSRGSNKINLGTPAGAYTVTVTATSGNTTQTTSILLSVAQK